jgi:hypothetical protein
MFSERANMGKKRSAFWVCLAAAFLAACAPSLEAIQTADAETQAVIPGSTFTPVPPTRTPTATLTITETPTKVPAKTLSPTLDPLYFQSNLKAFLVQEADIPPLANYTSSFHPPVFVSNADFSQSMGADGNEYLGETGRINGWEVSVDFEGDPDLAIPPFGFNNQVDLFYTIEGAQLALARSANRYITENGFAEVNSPFTNGEVNRAFYLRYQEQTDSGQYSLIYIIMFSYRNVVETVQESGLERPIDPIFMADIAQRLLVRLQASPPDNP